MMAQQRAKENGVEQRSAMASAQRISDWLSGRNVPARFESLSPVLHVLSARARRRAGTPSEAVNLKAWRTLWASAHKAPAEGPASVTVSPYPEGGVYSQEHVAVLFGRRRALTSLLSMVRMSATPQRPADLVMLTGASGVGKSALLRAGLIPALRSEGGQWAIAYITPGREPLRRLAQGFDSETGSETGLSPSLLPSGIDPAAVRRWSGGRRVLLIVDQLEDLYDPRIEPAVREAFLIQLKHLSGFGSVLVSVRSDALVHCTRYSWLLNAVQHNSFTLSSMLRQEMVSVVTGPARTLGVTVDPGVVELVVSALESGRQPIGATPGAANPGSLPLLFDTMRSLWSAHTGDRVDVATYRRVGGVAQVACRMAEQAWERLTPDEQTDAQRILLTLITVHRDGVMSRRAPLAELRRITGHSAGGRRTIERLARERLICLEPRHAALVHDTLLGWDRLRGWIAEQKPTLLWRQRIEEDAAEWVAAGRDPGLLYRSIRLTTAIDHADPMLSAVTTEFLRTSARAELSATMVSADHGYREAVGQ